MNLGNLKIIIGGDSKDLDRALAGAESRIAGFSRRLMSLVAGLGLAAAVVGLLHFEKKTFETIDAQSELAYRVGASVSAIQVLSAVGDKAGVSQEALAKALGLMNMRLAEAARTAAGPAHEALRRIGLSANDLLKLNADERMAVLADRFQKLGLTAAQQAEVLRNFGIRQQEVINLLEGGGDAIRKTRKDLEGYGVALSTLDAQSVEAANDAFKDAKLAIQGVANQIAVALAPLLGTLANDFAEAGKATGGFRDDIQSAVAAAVRAFGALTREIYYIRVGWDDAVAEIVSGINFISTAANKLTFFLDPFLEKIPMVGAEYGKLRDKLEKPASNEEWDKWFEELKRKWNETAQAAADAQDKMRGRKGRDQDNLTSEQRDQLEKRFTAMQKSLANEAAALDFWRKEELLKLKEFEEKKIYTAAERNAVRLAIEEKYQRDKAELIFQKLQEAVATENEILAHKHMLQLRAIEDFEKAGIITENQAAELRRKYAERQALDIIQLQAKQYSGLANIVDTAMGHISQIIGKEGGAAFEIMKAISIATALVKGFEATVSAYAYGAQIGGPPLGAVMAGIAAAGVAAQIAKIAMTKPQGSGGTVTAPAASAGAAAAPAAAPQGPAGGTLTVQGINPGALFSGEAMRGLAEQLLEYQRNGGRVVLA